VYIRLIDCYLSRLPIQTLNKLKTACSKDYKIKEEKEKHVPTDTELYEGGQWIITVGHLVNCACDKRYKYK